MVLDFWILVLGIEVFWRPGAVLILLNFGNFFWVLVWITLGAVLERHSDTAQALGFGALGTYILAGRQRHGMAWHCEDWKTSIPI